VVWCGGGCRGNTLTNYFTRFAQILRPFFIGFVALFGVALP